MLVVCNGAWKGGSSWITQIIQAHGKWSSIPDQYQFEEKKNPWLNQEEYSRFFAAREYETDHWYCKQHWRGNKKYLKLLDDPDVKLINIVRDLRDVMVSRYFFSLRIGQTTAENIQDYYFHDGGRAMMQLYLRYHLFWHHSEMPKQPYLCVYENLKSDFDSEVRGLFEFLGEPLCEEKTRQIYDMTCFKNKKVTGEGSFFRKGVVGDWVNHLNDEIVADIQEMMITEHYPHLELQTGFQKT